MTLSNQNLKMDLSDSSKVEKSKNDKNPPDKSSRSSSIGATLRNLVKRGTSAYATESPWQTPEFTMQDVASAIELNLDSTRRPTSLESPLSERSRKIGSRNRQTSRELRATNLAPLVPKPEQMVVSTGRLVQTHRGGEHAMETPTAMADDLRRTAAVALGAAWKPEDSTVQSHGEIHVQSHGEIHVQSPQHGEIHKVPLQDVNTTRTGGGWLSYVEPAKPVLASPGHPAGADWRPEASARSMPPKTTRTNDETVIVHYSVPAGHRFLPIMINEAVTMIQVGKDGDYKIYEPINTFLKSPEQGLRYFRSMNVDDPYTGVGDLAPWGMSLVGPISDDEKWMVNPSAVNDDEHGEIHLPITDSSTTERYSISSPELPHAGTATTYNPNSSSTGTEDVDISLLAELGEAITRGVTKEAERAQLPSITTSPSTYRSNSITTSPYDQNIHISTAVQPQLTETYEHAGPTILDNVAEVGLEIAVTAAVSTAGAIGGAAAGEIIGGDIASSHLGPIAEPLGAFAGRNIGRVVGGALGAAAIRCPSRSASRKRSTSQVRFSPNPYERNPNAAQTMPIQFNTGKPIVVDGLNSPSIDTSQIMSFLQQQNLEQQRQQQTQIAQQQSQMEQLLSGIGSMIQTSNDAALRREEEQKEYFRTQLAQAFTARDKEAQILARDQLAVTSQVSHLTETVKELKTHLSAQTDFAVDTIQQVRDEFSASLEDLRKQVSGGNAGSSQDRTRIDGKDYNMPPPEPHEAPRPAKLPPGGNNTKIPGPYSVTCLYCDGEMPKIIARQCGDCSGYFHQTHYQPHREEWPCPKIDEYDQDNWCHWCHSAIQEEQNKVHCTDCYCNLHDTCFKDHLPCPGGWLSKDSSEEPANLPRNLDNDLAETHVDGDLAQLKTDMKNIGDKIEAIETKRSYNTPRTSAEHAQAASKASGYPLSPSQQPTGLPVLGSIVATDQEHSGFAVQYSKPREADVVKLMAFPKPGTSFERWWDHALDSISSSTSFCTEAYRWALQCEKSETTFEMLGSSGSFVRLDALLLTALMECIPGDTHLLRQEIKKAKTEQRNQHEKNITGRQVLWMTHRYFAMDEKDKAMTDTARLHKIILTNGDVQQWVYRWDEMLSIMKKRPADEDLMSLFVLQLDVNLPKNHDFHIEYLLWYNRPPTDATRNYQGIWQLVHDFVRRKRDSKHRREALKDHLPGLGGAATSNQPKGQANAAQGKGGNGDEPKVCFAWRDKGECNKHTTGECMYAHPKALKGKGKSGSKKGKDGKGASKGKSSGSGGKKGESWKGGDRSASPKRTVVTDMSKLCKDYLKGTCKKGKGCSLHHNEPCRFFANGSCSKGDKCPFPHWNAKAAAALTEPKPPAEGAGDGNVEKPNGRKKKE